MFTLYILYSEKMDHFYVGYTNNIERRLKEHNTVRGKFTDRGIPWKLVYSENYETKQEAKNREAEIKAKKSRTYIQQLIAKTQ